MHLLMPLMLLALPCTVVSIVCGALGVAIRSRALLVTAASCSVPMFLYILAGEAWWRPIVPVIIAMYFTAAYVVPKRQSLAAALVAPYVVFLALLANALWFQHPR
jgi:hypothetical protein